MSKVIDQFPMTTGPLVVIPSGSDDTRRSFRVGFLRQQVPVLVEDKALPNLNWYAAAKIQVKGCDIGRVGDYGATVIVNDELPRAAFWLTDYALTGAGGLVDVEWQIRSCTDCLQEVLPVSGKIHLTDVGQRGMIVLASGYLGNGYELWMRVNSLAVGAQPVMLGLEVRASRFHGGPREVVKGSVSI